ncbi:conserved protein of unknown function [Nitrospira japonica]|uniref:Type II secretion system protein H n=1 Tax=Nitrospira japonica TaxID=1325564 RepID=A0A1W1I219_9BACT|nr:GspH/FimT family pseudopilin [Nitrospira japonica]SLM46909.1 conserved protein of unknown function [Nitrospira japonica]
MPSVHVLRPNAQERGASLTEVLMVMVILALVAALAGPSYKAAIARAQARSVAAEIASGLRLTRQLAMSRRERLLVQFDQARRALTFMRADSGDVLDEYQYADKGVMLDVPSAGPNVLFYPSGRSATATTIAIVDHMGRRITLTVSITGRVSLS